MPIGVVLAGGRASRLGGDKTRVELAGRPLIAWPLAALAEALGEVVVVAKAATPLPDLEVQVWFEPDEPSHPRAGIVHALERAGGRAVLVCAGDMPLVDADLLRRLADEPADGAPAVVPRAGGRVQPLLARYEPGALAPLRAAAPDAALTETVLALGPRLLDLPDARPFLNVNTPEDLAAAAQFLSRDS
jgi:molybdopterin-guanine dinucleotide biosynthesis protein A